MDPGKSGMFSRAKSNWRSNRKKMLVGSFCFVHHSHLPSTHSPVQMCAAPCRTFQGPWYLQREYLFVTTPQTITPFDDLLVSLTLCGSVLLLQRHSVPLLGLYVALYKEPSCRQAIRGTVS